MEEYTLIGDEILSVGKKLNMIEEWTDFLVGNCRFSGSKFLWS